MVIEVALAIVVVVAGTGGAGVALAWLNDRRHAANERRMPAIDPKRALDVRFANGEIDEADYLRRMHLLTYGPPMELDRPPD